MLMRTPASVRQFLAAMTCVASPVMGQLPTTRLDAVFPPGLQAGSETTVALTGLDLAEVDRLIFSDAGLSAVHGEGLNFKVTASAGIQPGLYEVRAAGRYGISASRLFAVGTLPELLESGPHDTPEKALLLTLPITVNGTTGTDAADYFRFAASKGVVIAGSYKNSLSLLTCTSCAFPVNKFIVV